MPNGQQEQQMRHFASLCFLVFNEALALQKKRYKCGGKKLG
jgi:hypothetical protein